MKKLIILAILFMFSLSLYSGIQWTSKITTTGKKKRDQNQIISTVSAQEGIVRQDFIEVKRKQGMYKKNSYWIYNSKDNMIYIVDPKKKTVTPMSMDYLLNMAHMANKLVKIRIEDYSAKSKKLPSEKVMGYACNHVKLITEYKMKMKITIIKKSFHIYEEKEIWGSRNVKGLNNLNKMFLNKNFKTGFEDLDELIRKQMAQHKNIGFPLKTIVKQIYKNKKGKVKSETVTTTVVEDIKIKKFPKSHFEVPADYKTNDPLQGPQK